MGRKKLIIAAAAVVVVIIVSVIALLMFSNRIVKAKLEQALGPNFRVERIELGWNKVNAVGPKFLREGKTAASASNIAVRADFLALLKSGLSISSLVLEDPVFRVEVSPKGEFIMPIALPAKEAATPGEKPGPITIKSIEIKNGTLGGTDLRMPAPNSVEAQKLNATLKDFSWPFKDAPSQFHIETQLAGRLVSGSAAANGSYNFVSKALTLSFDGKNLAYMDTSGSESAPPSADPGQTAPSPTAGPALRTQGVSFAAQSEAVGAKPIRITKLVLTRPFVQAATDSQGRLKAPFGGPAKKTEEKKKAGTQPGTQVEVTGIRVDDGALVYLDGKVSAKPYPIRVTGIALTADRFSTPAAGKPTGYKLSAQAPGVNGTGAVAAAGTADLRTGDTISKITARDLDLLVFKPYIARQGAADFTRGFIDLDADVTVMNKNIRAPVHAVIRDLQFPAGTGGLADRFLGVPRTAVVKAMQQSDNRLELDFVIEGNTGDPRFNFRETLVKSLTSGFAQKLGVSAIESGQEAIREGRKTVKEYEEKYRGYQEQYKGLEKQFRDIFK